MRGFCLMRLRVYVESRVVNALFSNDACRSWFSAYASSVKTFACWLTAAVAWLV